VVERDFERVLDRGQAGELNHVSHRRIMPRTGRCALERGVTSRQAGGLEYRRVLMRHRMWKAPHT
jgi:hypothetical protein